MTKRVAAEQNQPHRADAWLAGFDVKGLRFSAFTIHQENRVFTLAVFFSINSPKARLDQQLFHQRKIKHGTVPKCLLPVLIIDTVHTEHRGVDALKGFLGFKGEQLRALLPGPLIIPLQVHPRIWQAEQEAIQSQIEELNSEVLAYEQLKSGKVRSIAVDSLESLPLALIQARIAQGLTQKDLAQRLGVREQQVQQDEENLYNSASLRRLKQVAEVLGVEMSGRLEVNPV